MDEAIQQAKTDPEPPLSELVTDIYSQIPPNFAVRKVDATYERIAK